MIPAPLGRALAALALVLAAAAPHGAAANELYYSFSFTGDGVTGEGTLVTASTPDPTAPLSDAYDILGIDGNVDGAAITGIIGILGGPAAYSPDGYFIYDNDFYPAGSASPAGGYFDDDGLLFSAAQGVYNLFYDGTNYWDWQDQGGGIAVSFTAADPPPPVSEPGTLLLLAAALAAGALLTRRHRPGR